ncbi:hypothetical protein LRS37_09205 [Neobacillus sedimentimangrovi]|uniref:Uncharacterized protein n=1 Tax=Neobacillus sedimentimangrovi TaxID=2699460 RepID=A0ABS8QIM3_9BACI|nr:hypothetical protein [Neobacillus sedimentimangrovi]
MDIIITTVIDASLSRNGGSNVTAAMSKIAMDKNVMKKTSIFERNIIEQSPLFMVDTVINDKGSTISISFYDKCGVTCTKTK